MKQPLPLLGAAAVRSRNRVTHDVKQKLFKFLNLSSDPAARFPPSVGVECRVARRANRDFRLVALHGTMKHSAETSRVIRSANHHD
jgi:hypothetical protein